MDIHTPNADTRVRLGRSLVAVGLCAIMLVASLLALGFKRPTHLVYRVTLIGDSLSVYMEYQTPLERADSDLQPVGLAGHVTAFGGFTSYDLRQVVLNVPEPPADFVLVQAGTNDLLLHREDPKSMGALLKAVTYRFPKAMILVAPIPASSRIPEQDRNVWNDATRHLVEETPRARFLPECPLDPNDYVADGVHLQVSGYQKLRARWLKGIYESLG